MHKPEADDGRGDHGSTYTRLEVMSKCKLLTLLVAFLVFLSTMIFVGVFNGPPVNKTNLAGDHFRCAHGFTQQMLETCSQKEIGIDTVTGGLEANKNIIQWIMMVSLPERTNLIKCMFEQCQSVVLNPQASDDPESSEPIHSVHYHFTVNYMTEKHRYLYMDVQFPNPLVTNGDYTFDVVATPMVKGQLAGKEGTDDWENIPLANPHEHLTVTCRSNQAYCDPIPYLRFGEVKYAKYKTDILLQFHTEDLPENGTFVEFSIVFGTVEFTNWVIGFKAFYFVASCVSCLVYFMRLNKVSVHERHLEQRWILYLSIALILLNEPLYAFELRYPVEQLKLLSVVSSTTFFCFLLTFWLIMFDNIHYQAHDIRIRFKTFFLPKVLFMGPFWLFSTMAYGFIKYQDDNDPTYDPETQFKGYKECSSIAIAMVSVYLIWLGFLCVRVLREIMSSLDEKFMIFVNLTFLVISLGIAGLVIGSYSPIPPNSGEWTGFYTLVNIYVMLLAYLYAPAEISIALSKQTDSGVETEILSPRSLAGKCDDPQEFMDEDKVEITVQNEESKDDY